MKRRERLLFILIILLLCISCAYKSLSPSNDTFYLIKIGESIFKNGIDMMDHFSWIPNLAYTYPHWLYSVILYFLYNNFGFTGIYISNIVVYFIIGLSFYYINSKVSKNELISFILTIICLSCLSTFAVARSHFISCFFFLWEVFMINKLIDTGKKRYIIYLALFSLLVANIHGTAWIMYFILFLPFFAEEILYIIFKKKEKIIFNNKVTVNKINNMKLVVISFLVSFLMGIFTPSRICYTYVFRTMLGNSQLYICEHLPLIIIHAPIALFILFILYFSNSKIKLHELLMLLGLFIMSFASTRHLIFVYTIGLLYITIILKRNLDNNQDKTFDILEKKLFNKCFVSVFLLIISIVCCFIKVKDNYKTSYVDESKYPVSAVKYIKENLDYQNIKLFNNYDIGSYLLFNDIKVFIDSRCDLYLKEFNGQNIEVFNDLTEIIDNYNYEEIFNKYEIEYVLLEKKELLHHIIKKDTNYEKIYDDEYFILYERKNS